jgi:hypothetical protein
MVMDKEVVVVTVRLYVVVVEAVVVAQAPQEGNSN